MGDLSERIAMSPDTHTKIVVWRLRFVSIIAGIMLILGMSMAGANLAHAKPDPGPRPSPTRVTLHKESYQGSYIYTYAKPWCKGAAKKLRRGHTNIARSWRAPWSKTGYAYQPQGGEIGIYRLSHTNQCRTTSTKKIGGGRQIVRSGPVVYAT